MRLAVLADIHSDLINLEKAFGMIRDLKVDRIVCLGDIVGYSYHYADYLEGRNPNACIQIVREKCDDVVCGNHDLHSVRKLPAGHAEIGMPSEWYDLNLGERSQVYGNRFWLYDDELEDSLTEESQSYLKELPETILIKDRKLNILATHFIWPDITGSRQEAPGELKDFQDHLKRVKKKRCLVGLCGHAHIEGYAQISKRAFGVNYFNKAPLIRRPQIIIAPAITRGKGRSGFLIIDTEQFDFEAIPLD